MTEMFEERVELFHHAFNRCSQLFGQMLGFTEHCLKPLEYSFI